MSTLSAAAAILHYTLGSGFAPGTFPTGVGQSVVVGNAGGLPAPGFRFDGDATDVWLDESQVARFGPDGTSLATDLSVLYGGVRLSGGAAALLPDGARITGLSVLRTTPGEMSTDQDEWTDGLPIFTVAGADQGAGGGSSNAGGGGGLYYSISDGALYLWSPALQCDHLCLGVDAAHAMLYVGTPHGVYSRNSDPGDRTTAWVRLGSFTRRVTRLQIVPDGDGNTVVWALVQETGSGEKTYHGIYRYPAYTGAASSPDLEGGWQPIVRAGAIVGHAMIATSSDDVWYIAKSDQGTVHRQAADGDHTLALPDGVAGTALHRVITPSPALDSVWVSTTGDDQPLYKSIFDGASWPAFAAGDPDHKLVGPDGARLGVNRVVGLGLTFLGAPVPGASGQYTAAFACCSAGLFWTADITTGTWQAVSAANGLDDVSVGTVAAGQQIQILGLSRNRVFMANTERLFVSHTGTNLWEEAAPHSSVGVGPALSALVAEVTATLPHNRLKTIGPMAASPIADYANTHVQVSGILPAGWYWWRTTNDYGAYEWTLVNPGAQSPRLLAHQVSDLASEQGTRTALLEACGRLASVAVRWLGEHAAPRVTLQLSCTFTTPEAALRRLRATMRVPVRYHGDLLARSSTGEAIGTTYVALDDDLLFVKSVGFAADGTLGPGVCTATVELSTSLGDDTSPEDLAAAILEDAANAKKRRRR